MLTGVLTDRLYRLCEKYGLLDPSQEGFRKLHCTQRQVQSLHWALADIAERDNQVYCVYIDLVNAFNSVDHEALCAWLRHINIPDVDLLQSIYEGAHYVADLPYGKSASVLLTRGAKQGDKLSPLLFSLVFNALLLALKKAGVGHRTVQGLRPSSRGFADDLAILTGSASAMNRALQVVADFCRWSGMRLNLTKSVITAWDYSSKRDLPTDLIRFEGQPLVNLRAEDHFRYLGVRASLVKKGKRKGKEHAPCLTSEKHHIFASTKELTTLSKNHPFLFRQMVPAMHMVATSRFRYSAPLVAWTDAELDELYTIWLQVNKASWRLPPGFPSAPFSFPADQGGCPVAHPLVHLVQALAKHIEQLVALPDELRETTRRQYQRLCDSCGCHTAQELAEFLREERSPRSCPIARLLRACAQLEIQIRLPACLSLGKTERETSWYAALKHIRQQVEAQEDEQGKKDLETIVQSWSAIRRRWRRRGVRFPRQLVVDPQQRPALWLVPQSLRPNPRWLEPLRRLLKLVDTVSLFRKLDRGIGVSAPPVHVGLIHDVLAGLQDLTVPVARLFEDERWHEIRCSAPVRSWHAFLHRQNFPCQYSMNEPAGLDPTWDLVTLGGSGEVARDQMRELVLYLAPSMYSRSREDISMEDRYPLASQWAPISLSRDSVEFVDTAGESVQHCGEFTIVSKDNLARIEKGGEYIATITQSRLGLLMSSFEASGLETTYILTNLPHWVKEVEGGEASRGIASHQFWYGIQLTLNADLLVGVIHL